MDCTEFSQMVVDLGREVPLDADLRREALDHAVECGDCAMRLRRERSLAIALRLWADADRAEGAPERVERELAASFSMAHRRRPTSWRRWLWAGGIAAAVLVIVALGVRFSERSTGVAPGSGQTRPAVPSQQKRIERLTPEFAKRESQSPAQQNPGTVAPVSPPAASGDEAIAATARRKGATARGSSSAITTTAGLLVPDFVPMPSADRDMPIIEGEVVRVEMSGLDLMQAGVPVAAGYSAQPVVADVLLDQNGTARAIRVVSTLDEQPR